METVIGCLHVNEWQVSRPGSQLTTPDRILRQEEQVGGAFGQAAHEVRVPLRASPVGQQGPALRHSQ